MTRNARRATLIAIIVMVLAAITLALRTPEQLVELAVVNSGEVEEIVREEGRTYVHERYVVSAPVSGYRPRLEWHVGDPVRAGDLLLQLQPAPSEVLDPRSEAAARADVGRAESALRAAQTNAEAARARLDFAEREHARLQALFEDGDISRQMLDQAKYARDDAEAHLRSAEFSIDVARHELDAARTRLQFSGKSDTPVSASVPIRAPTQGIVLAVPAESEGVVQAGAPLLEIGDPASLEVHVDLLTTEAVRLDPGTPVRIVDWGGGRPLDGRVRRVEPAAFTKISALGVEEQRTRVIVDIVTPREDWLRLGDGFRVDVEFLLWRGENVLRVPVGALFREGDRWMVFRIRHGRAYATPIELGHRGEEHAEVLGGLAPGDAVVLYPGNDLADGVRVTSREE